MSTRYRLGADGHTVWDGERMIAVAIADLSDGARIIRALNEREKLAQLRVMRQLFRELRQKWSRQNLEMPDADGQSFWEEFDEALNGGHPRVRDVAGRSVGIAESPCDHDWGNLGGPVFDIYECKKCGVRQ